MAGTNALNAKKVGSRIRERRLELELSQRQLQDDGISFAYVSRIENGQRDPSLSALIALAARMREAAAAEIAQLKASGGREAAGVRRRRIAELRQLEADTTALYLLTGSTHNTCPFCGRHEQGDTTDGKGRPRRSRH